MFADVPQFHIHKSNCVDFDTIQSLFSQKGQSTISLHIRGNLREDYGTVTTIFHGGDIFPEWVHYVYLLYARF